MCRILKRTINTHEVYVSEVKFLNKEEEKAIKFIVFAKI